MSSLSIRISSPNLNTSYVKVKLVHLLLFLGQYRYLNTSYVKVKQSKWQNRCKLSKI